LSYLRRFPFERIKIDQSFVREITTSEEAIYVIRAIVGLCRDLGIRTTAEGVETAAQLAILHAEGSSELQGYLFGRPTPLAGLDRFFGARLIPAAPQPLENAGA
jgi:EAL domain-containing protein (putative c-di-GMP-specific phosphodiesterase class I)